MAGGGCSKVECKLKCIGDQGSGSKSFFFLVFFPSRVLRFFESAGSGRYALQTKGAVYALPGERPKMLRPGPLGRCLGEFFPCGGICVSQLCLLWWSYMFDAVQHLREIDHGCRSYGLCVCFVECSG